MAQLHRSRASLRIGGDHLIPDEITKLIGASPTHAHIKGQKITGSKTGKVFIKKSGMWRLEATAREPEDLDGQIDEILSQLTGDLSVWAELRKHYQIDIFYGFFMESSNEGLTLSARSLAALAERGIEIGFDIYGPSDAVYKEDQIET